ncbi:unnamed protein product [Mesocestoides corti]|uniref:Cystinosin homolog n=1 Tax=Mesocestoides corti TaxID=53468 RepID=A0A0R3UP71_MESCO|nr:unnamed protein product [Mesocestoides corti]
MPIQPIAPFKRVSGSNETHQTVVYSNKPGAIKLGLNTTDLNITNIERLHTSITVVRRQSLYVFQQIVGWIYFLSWTISFYPQVILNFTRKSVTGLSFDFIAFNLIGFACYTAFNAGLYFVPYIQEQYFRNHPLGVNPVQLNDLFFSLHATAIVLVQIVQCLIYERGSQRVSKTCTATICMMLIFILISTILAALDVITWLTALYLYSYVKLLVTLIKYLPQVALNCRRRSTVGWSLGNVVCDFVGGVLSVFQMFLIAYNRGWPCWVDCITSYVCVPQRSSKAPQTIGHASFDVGTVPCCEVKLFYTWLAGWLAGANAHEFIIVFANDQIVGDVPRRSANLVCHPDNVRALPPRPSTPFLMGTDWVTPSAGQLVLLSFIGRRVVFCPPDDWTSVIGSPTKLILGLISVGFDCIFFGQHHCYGSSGDVVQVDDDGVEESAGLVGDSNQASQASSRDSVPA